MARIAFQRFPDQNIKDLEFKEARLGYLIAVCHEFAKSFDNQEIYNIILNKKVSIYINDKLINVDDWHITEVKEDDTVIITPTIEGRNGGLIMIALGVALIATGQWYLVPGTLSAAYATGLGVSLVLGGISSLLFAPDMPSSPSISSSKQTQTYNWSGIKTVAQSDTPIPIVYGTHPIGGNVISLFIESDGSISYLNMLLALCEGEIEGICKQKDHTSICTTSDYNNAAYADPAIKIDDQPLSFYKDVEWWYRKGTGLPDTSQSKYDPSYQNIIPHFDGARIQYDDGREITEEWTEYITTKEVDQVYLNFNIPQLYNGEGSDLVEETVAFKVQYSTDGVTYYDYEGSGTYRYAPSVSGNRSQYCTCTSYTFGNYKYTYKEPVYKIRVTSNNFEERFNIMKNNSGSSLYKIEVDILDNDLNLIESRAIYSTITVTNLAPWDPMPVFSYTYSDSQFNVGEYVVSLDRNVVPGDLFTISSSIITGPTSSIISITGKTKTGLYSTIRLDFNEMDSMPGREVYYIRAKRTDGGKSDSLKVANGLILQSVVEIVNGLFIYPYTALLGLRIKATDQLSGAIPNIVTLLKGKKIEVPDLSGSESFQSCFWDDTDNRWEYNDTERTWDNTTYTTEYSNNSMLCVRDLMLSERYGLGEYYTSSDFDISEIITTIRECWKRYDAYSGEDYLRWWDSGTDSDWKKWWDFDYRTSVNLTKVYDSSARTITVTGNGKYTTDNPSYEYLRLNTYPITRLKTGQSYDLSITLSVTDFPLTITVYGMVSDQVAVNLGTLSNKTSGTHTLSFSVLSGEYKTIQLLIYGELGSPSYAISDIGITKTASSYEHYHTWNGVIESGQSAMTVLTEMCDAFRCWPIWHSGKINFVSDRDTTPVHTLSVGNTESFSQSFTPLSEIPYRLIGQFTDEARDYNMRSLISRTSRSDIIKINERTIGLKGITSKAKASRELKFKHNKVINCTNSIVTKCSADFIHGTAGDIINLQDDLPLWGHGGNIISYTATNFTIDTPYTFNTVATYTFVVKYQGVDNSQLSATIDTTSISNNDSLQTFPIISIPASPCSLSAFTLNTTGYQSKKIRVTSTSRTEEDMVEVTGVEHFSSLYSSEATSAIIIDTYSPLVPKSPNLIPSYPVSISVTPLTPYEGLGFAISARPNPSDYGVTEIVVQIDKTNNREFETIGILYPPLWTTTYINSSLKYNYSYNFRFFSKTQYKNGVPAEASCTIPESGASLAPPKGLRIKGQTSNSNEFDGKDVTIIWDSAGLSTSLNYSIKGYKINVYKNSIIVANLLRTDFVTTEEYTYTYDMNVGDNGTANGTLVFQLTTLTTNGWESTSSSHITVSNSSPSTPSGLTTTPWMKGIQFRWNKNTETDLDYYSYRTKGIAGKLLYTQGTGEFTAGERFIQWNGNGEVTASALIDSVDASYVYLSSIDGTFSINSIVGQKDYSVELLPLGNCSTNWFDEVATPWVYNATDGTYDIDGSQGGTPELHESDVLTVGGFYKTVFTVKNRTAGAVAILSPDYVGWRDADGTYTQYSKALYHFLNIRADADFIGSVDDFSCKKITNAALVASSLIMDSWSGWTNITNTEVSRFLDETELDTHPNETTISIQLKAVDVYANESATVATSDITLGLNIKSTDISKFAITSSKIFNKIPVITGDTWSDNTVLASEIQWNQHSLYYNGTLCTIASGHTSDKYIYWRNLDTSYSTSASHPSALASPITDNDFIIAVNINGVHDLAWNAIANQVIGSAYIQNLAVQTAHIDNIAVTSAKIASLAVVDGHIANLSGDKLLLTSNISINSTTFGSSGIQIQYNSGDPRFYVGNATSNYINYTSTSLRLGFGTGGGLIFGSGSDITLAASTLSPAQIRFRNLHAISPVDILLETTSENVPSLYIKPDEDGYGRMYIGNTSDNRFHEIFLNSYGNTSSQMLSKCSLNSTEYAAVSLFADSIFSTSVTLVADGNYVYWNSNQNFGPNNDKQADCGQSSAAWDYVYADDFTNVADYYYMDSIDDLKELHKIKGSGKIDKITGLELIDDDTLPDILKARYKKEHRGEVGKFLEDPDKKPYISIKAAISHLQGCIRQLDNKVINLTSSLTELKDNLWK